MLHLGLTLALLPTGQPLVAVDPIATQPPAVPSVRYQDDEDDDEDKPLPDRRPEIKELLSQLKGHIKAKGKEDQEALSVMERLAEEFKVSGPKDRASIVDGLGDVVETKRKDKAKDVPDEEVHTFAAVMLGRCGKDAGPRLIKLVNHKNLREKTKARRAAILALGRTGHPKAKKPMIDLLKDEEHYVAGAAAEAMGSLAGLDEDDRKDMVKEIINEVILLVDQLDVAAGDGSLGGGNFEEFQKRYDAMSGGAQSSLEALTGTSEPDFKAWRTWYNKNKKKSWD